MTQIDKNYGPIILGDYIEKQENYIDKQLNVINGSLPLPDSHPNEGRQQMPIRELVREPIQPT